MAKPRKDELMREQQRRSQTAAGFPPGTVLYRVAAPVVPAEATLKDVLDYEADELGNAHVRDAVLALGIDPAAVPSSSVVWGTRTQEEAARYVEVDLPGHGYTPLDEALRDGLITEEGYLAHMESDVREFGLPKTARVLAEDGEGGVLAYIGATPLEELVAAAQAVRAAPSDPDWLFGDGRQYEEDTDDHYLLMLWPEHSELPAGSFSPAEEKALVLDVLTHMRTLLSGEEEFVRSQDRDGAALIRHRDDKMGFNVLFTNNPPDIGRGSGGPGSARVFYQPYSLKPEFRTGDQSPSFLVDGVYTLVHELHHAFGSSTEMDGFSDLVALDYHLSKGNTLAPDAVRFEIENRFLLSLSRSASAGRAKRQLAWLYRRNPHTLQRLADEFDADYGARLRGRAKGWARLSEGGAAGGGA